jgi:hypothetical protein
MFSRILTVVPTNHGLDTDGQALAEATSEQPLIHSPWPNKNSMQKILSAYFG